MRKRIIIRYTYDCKHWLDCEASFLLCSNDNYEVWHFKTPNTYGAKSCTFAICCKINNIEYWDNNKEMNYNLKWYFPTKILQGCCVILDNAFKHPDIFYGNILVKNIGYHKQIKVRYFMDQCKNYNEADAVYSNQLPENLEMWKFRIKGVFKGKIKFYVYFMVNGNTYYDKNFGRYYIL